MRGGEGHRGRRIRFTAALAAEPQAWGAPHAGPTGPWGPRKHSRSSGGPFVAPAGRGAPSPAGTPPAAPLPAAVRRHAAWPRLKLVRPSKKARHVIGLRRCSALGRSRGSMGPEQIGADGNVRLVVSGARWGVLPCCRRPKAPQSVRACAPWRGGATAGACSAQCWRLACHPGQPCSEGQAAGLAGGCQARCNVPSRRAVAGREPPAAPPGPREGGLGPPSAVWRLVGMRQTSAEPLPHLPAINHWASRCHCQCSSWEQPHTPTPVAASLGWAQSGRQMLLGGRQPQPHASPTHCRETTAGQ